MDIVRLVPGDLRPLEEFLTGAGSSLETFRYFDSRPLGTVSSHIVTLVGILDGKTIAYGHLDPEAGITWLGVCVSERYRGKGLGKAMVKRLLDESVAARISCLRLATDEGNLSARHLYEKVGFKEFLSKDGKVYYEWREK